MNNFRNQQPARPPSEAEQQAEFARQTWERLYAIRQRFVDGTATDAELSQSEGDAMHAGQRPIAADANERRNTERLLAEVNKIQRERRTASKREVQNAEDEQRIAALTVAERARVKVMLRSGFVGTAAEFETGFPRLWEAYRDAQALLTARDNQDAVLAKKRREYTGF